MDKLALNYRLDGTGWANAHIRIGDSPIDCDISYYPNDALDSLSGALVELILAAGEQCVDVDIDTGTETTRLDNQRTVVWPGEPWANIWYLEFHMPDTLNVSVAFHEEYDTTETSSPSRTITGTCSFRQVTSAIVSALESLLVSEGIIGYRSQWVEYEFPLARFLILKRFTIDFSDQPISDTLKSELTVSNWKADFDILSNLGIGRSA